MLIAALLSSVTALIAVSAATNSRLFDEDDIELIKKAEVLVNSGALQCWQLAGMAGVTRCFCVSSNDQCFNTDQCCTGLTCISLSNTDSDDAPGQCVKRKDMQVCSTAEDCYRISANMQCIELSPGNRYCVRVSPVSSRSSTGPRKHLAYARLLSNIAGSCESDADCQTNDVSSPGARLCCQHISRGRLGTKRICDRITAVSVCIPPPRK